MAFVPTITAQTYSISADISADPPAVGPGEETKLRVSFSYVGVDLGTQDNPRFTVTLYDSSGQPISVTVSVPGEASVSGTAIPLKPYIASQGFYKQVVAPSSPGQYSYSVKIFENGAYIDNSKDEVFVQVRSGGTPETLCGGGSGCIASVNPLGASGTVDAGQMINFSTQYRDNGAMSGYFKVELWISVEVKESGKTPDNMTYSKKGETAIINDNSSKTMSWQTTAGAGGTVNGTHVIKIKVYETDPSIPGDNLMAIAFTEVNIKNDAAPTPSPSPSDPPARPKKITPITSNDVGGGWWPGGGTGADAGIIEKIIRIFSQVIGVMGFFGIVAGGILYITSNGDQAKTMKARKSIIYSVFGVILAILSYVILKAVVNFLNDII